MSNIIGITLGPICRTTLSAKKTKALWASSYFFSYLAKEITEPFKENQFIVPILNDEQLWKSTDGIGRFPDRFIFYAEEGDFNKLKKQTRKVIGEIAAEMARFFVENDRKNQTDEEQLRLKIRVFLEKYLKVYFFEKAFPESENIVNDCNAVLDLIEYEDSYSLQEPKNYLTRFFEHDKLGESFLVHDAFGDAKRHLFDSLDAISKVELPKDYSDEMLKPYHNYIAIISADGDNMSSSIKALLETEKQNGQAEYPGATVQGLSKCLLEFGGKVAKLTFRREGDKEDWKYEARIVFLGGDDLLIFAPVMYKGKTVFDFIEGVSYLFDKEVSGLTHKPTLSFGVSVSYMKYPMHESLEISQKMLEVAKSKKEPYRNKNSVAFSLQKHSGQTYTGELSKDKSRNSFAAFQQLLSSYKSEDDKIIASVIYWLSHHTDVLTILLKLKTEEERRQRIQCYFNNSFNESVHKSMETFYKNLAGFLVEFAKATDEPIELLRSALKFIHFIKSKRDE